MDLRRLTTTPLPLPADWAAVSLWLIVGFGFMQHGYAKLAHGPKHFKAILHAMGMPFTHLRSLATIAVELVGGLLVLASASEPLAAVPMIAVLLVAIVTVHRPNGTGSVPSS